ncbi:MAG: hypothetical protein HY553_22420 [Elusimicrobia bacterium]|nr:hypothetical protein [Elusimicrobiota bacterium]
MMSIAMSLICMLTHVVPAEAREKSKVALRPTIETVMEKMGGKLVEVQDLFGFPEFIRVYEHPERHYNEALDLLKAKDVKDDEKLIATYAMQRLTRKTYLEFLNALLDMRVAGAINDMVYTNGVFPPPEWNTTLQVHYRDPKVMAFLKKAKDANTSYEDSCYIDKILSGDALKDVEAMREREELPPGR